MKRKQVSKRQSAVRKECLDMWKDMEREKALGNKTKKQAPIAPNGLKQSSFDKLAGRTMLWASRQKGWKLR